jgi:glycosyltransferase involved in cell wall biosynthesis
MEKFSTVIIIPCYNEATRLQKSLFIEFSKYHPDFKIIFVNDGSTDSTLDVLNSFCSDQSSFDIYNLSKNLGKAEAVRLGLLYGLSNFELEYIGYLDADLATPIEEMLLFIEHFKKNVDLQLVVGTRIKILGNKIKRSRMRHILGRIFATVSYLALPIPIYDTQCGAKLFKQSLAKKLFNTPFISRWLFDIEIFARIVNEVGKNEVENIVNEFPIKKWIEIKESKLRIVDFIRMPVELFRIRNEYRIPLKG